MTRPSQAQMLEAWTVVGHADAFPASYVALCRRFLQQWALVKR